jgi:hypothetical protein
VEKLLSTNWREERYNQSFSRKSLLEADQWADLEIVGTNLVKCV